MADDIAKVIGDFSTNIRHQMDRMKHAIKRGDNVEALAIYADMVRMSEFYSSAPKEIFQKKSSGDLVKVGEKADEIAKRKRNILVEMTAQAKEILQNAKIISIPLRL
ncbi:hypothetical protein KY363_00915 [Candidatus Woesearchaeota archaeon]|nr:hypothetical protein [Candidatus Woesearchaeota archaeon]